MDDLLVVNITVRPFWAFLELSQEHFTSTETCFHADHVSKRVTTGRGIIHIASQCKKPNQNKTTKTPNKNNETEAFEDKKQKQDTLKWYVTNS